MSVRTLYDEQVGNACLFDSVTDTAFGPLFEDREAAEDFLDWLAANDGRDSRMLSDLDLNLAVGRWTDQRDES